MLYFRFDSGFRVIEVIDADVAAGFYPVHRSGIAVGDVLTDDDLAVIGVERVNAPPKPPQVGPVEFKLLFTSAERVALKQARATDPVLDDFFELVEDPRLQTVNLGLPSVAGALQYMVSLGLLAADRPAQILAGEFQ